VLINALCLLSLPRSPAHAHAYTLANDKYASSFVMCLCLRKWRGSARNEPRYQACEPTGASLTQTSLNFAPMLEHSNVWLMQFTKIEDIG
jgi:hypothetical protein